VSGRTGVFGANRYEWSLTARLVMIDRGVSRGSHFVSVLAAFVTIARLMDRSNVNYRANQEHLHPPSRFLACELWTAGLFITVLMVVSTRKMRLSARCRSTKISAGICRNVDWGSGRKGYYIELACTILTTAVRDFYDCVDA
jgi:hypothetical protein